MFAVLYTSDNKYAPYMGISIVSLLENSKDTKIRVYAVVVDVDADNIAKLNSLKDKYSNLDLRIVEGNKYIDSIKAKRFLPYRNSYATYLRLFFHYYIDDDVERLLYLDSDTVIDSPIDELIRCNMDNICLGAVCESVIDKYKSCLNFSNEETYFNAGVLLINVVEWSKGKYLDRLLNIMSDVKNIHVNNDQDCLNILFRNSKITLSPKYNFQPCHSVYSNKIYFSCYNKMGGIIILTKLLMQLKVQ